MWGKTMTLHNPQWMWYVKCSFESHESRMWCTVVDKCKIIGLVRRQWISTLNQWRRRCATADDNIARCTHSVCARQILACVSNESTHITRIRYDNNTSWASTTTRSSSSSSISMVMPGGSDNICKQAKASKRPINPSAVHRHNQMPNYYRT